MTNRNESASSHGPSLPAKLAVLQVASASILVLASIRGVAVAAPDSLRAESLWREGCLRYVEGHADSAAALFSAAAELVEDGRYLHGKALASLARGDTVAAEAAWVTMAADTTDLAGLFHLSCLLHARGEHEQALNGFRRTAGSSSSGVVAASLAMGHATASLAGRPAEAKELLDKLNTRFPVVLERAALARDKGFAEEDIDRRDDFAAAQTDAPPVPPPPVSVETAATTNTVPKGYTIQVGAFSRVENAQRLRSELGERFGTVRVVAAPGKEATLHKVWVGRFVSEDEALAFAAQHLRALGMSYRVVQE